MSQVLDQQENASSDEDNSSPSSHYRKVANLLLFALFVGILLLAAYAIVARLSSERIDYDNLSIQNLINAGYYAYVLPDEQQSQLAWIRRIFINPSFDWHCDQTSESHWNPLRIRYDDQYGKNKMFIEISPSDALFDDREAHQTVALEAEWIPSHMGVYYHGSEGGTAVLMRDTFGNEVVFSTWEEDIRIIADFINQLVYVGPPNPSTLGNPWENACK